MAEQNHKQDDEITLKDLILKLKEYGHALMKSWILVGLFCIPFLVYFVYVHLNTRVSYKAELTYMLNSNNDNSMAGFASLLGSFGLNRNNRGFSLDKLIELSKSRVIVQKTLFEKISLDQTNDYIANHLIKLYGFQEKWGKKNSDLSNFIFSHGVIDSFSTNESYALKTLYSSIVGSPDDVNDRLMMSTYDENSGILTLSFQSVSENLSVDFLNTHFEELKEYFINSTIQKQRLNYQIMKQKTDSLYSELRSAELDLANFKDRNLGIFTRKDNLTELQLEGKIKMLYAGLSKALENLEIADFTLKYQTPFIQTVDQPIMPLKPIRSSLLVQLFKALFLGFFTGSLWIVGRKIYKEVMSE